ncbi:MAG TPA: isochorismatase family protein [Cytophagaceae bacterium]|jgi:nicotinamidase-related amidase|nr:isochorismatase family protein [Cytophagaceae bacterium]
MITEIDKNTALILIDLQKGVLAIPSLLHPLKDILENSTLLIDAFRKTGLPIVIVNVNPAGASWTKARKDSAAVQSIATPMADFADIADEIKTQPTDIFITKKTWNAFYNTSLHEELQRRNITGIVLGGVSTSAGVEGTARAASELGYNISFATDAMTDRNAEAHHNSIQNIFPRLGESGMSSDVIEKLKIV